MMHFMAKLLPEPVQLLLKQWKYAWEIGNETFRSPEPDYAALPYWLKEGDCAIDVGANVGHYTLRMAECVGTAGHVYAFEPVPLTYKLLHQNVKKLKQVHSYNTAVSNHNLGTYMSVPNDNYYRASVGHGKIPVQTLFLDQMFNPEINPVSVKLMKIDVEGHELQVLQGARELIARCRPVLIVEGDDAQVEAFLDVFGYQHFRLAHSPNRIYTAR